MSIRKNIVGVVMIACGAVSALQGAYVNELTKRVRARSVLTPEEQELATATSNIAQLLQASPDASEWRSAQEQFSGLYASLFALFLDPKFIDVGTDTDIDDILEKYKALAAQIGQLSEKSPTVAWPLNAADQEKLQKIVVQALKTLALPFPYSIYREPSFIRFRQRVSRTLSAILTGKYLSRFKDQLIDRNNALQDTFFQSAEVAKLSTMLEPVVTFQPLFDQLKVDVASERQAAEQQRMADEERRAQAQDKQAERGRKWERLLATIDKLKSNPSDSELYQAYLLLLLNHKFIANERSKELKTRYDDFIKLTSTQPADAVALLADPADVKKLQSLVSKALKVTTDSAMLNKTGYRTFKQRVGVILQVLCQKPHLQEWKKTLFAGINPSLLPAGCFVEQASGTSPGLKRVVTQRNVAQELRGKLGSQRIRELAADKQQVIRDLAFQLAASTDLDSEKATTLYNAFLSLLLDPAFISVSTEQEIQELYEKFKTFTGEMDRLTKAGSIEGWSLERANADTVKNLQASLVSALKEIGRSNRYDVYGYNYLTPFKDQLAWTLTTILKSSYLAQLKDQLITQNDSFDTTLFRASEIDLIRSDFKNLPSFEPLFSRLKLGVQEAPKVVEVPKPPVEEVQPVPRVISSASDRQDELAQIRKDVSDLKESANAGTLGNLDPQIFAHYYYALLALLIDPDFMASVTKDSVQLMTLFSQINTAIFSKKVVLVLLADDAETAAVKSLIVRSLRPFLTQGSRLGSEAFKKRVKVVFEALNNNAYLKLFKTMYIDKNEMMAQLTPAERKSILLHLPMLRTALISK